MGAKFYKYEVKVEGRWSECSERPLWGSGGLHSEGPTIFDRKVELRVVLNSIRCIQVIKKNSGRTDI